MGNYKPGATYVHESPDGGNTIYAREVGSTERRLVGYSADRIDELNAENEKGRWLAVLRASKTNPALQDAVERAIIIYELYNTTEEPMWHPV
jgi:hypothetical protein